MALLVQILLSLVVPQPSAMLCWHEDSCPPVAFEIDSSSNLIAWQPLGYLTNLNAATNDYSVALFSNAPWQFYRVGAFLP